MKEVYLTKEGLETMQQRLDYLLTKARREVAEKIKIAREYGDISENAEYDAAKDEQVFIEQEIKELEDRISAAVIIAEENLTSGKVQIGCTVVVKDLEFDEVMELKIVGTAEADAMLGKISNESPLGAALLDKKKGEVAVVKTPTGHQIDYKIMEIRI